MGESDDPLSIRQLEVFVSLVDHGSFTLAARQLGLSQSTVSGHVADLERRLGVRVVERGRGPVRPTAAGHALLLPARQTLQSERAARHAVAELRGLLRGSLVVGGSTIPAVYLLPLLFRRFHARHPEVSLRIETGDSLEILDRVRDADLELGVVGLDPEPYGFTGLKVGEDRLLFVLRPDHELAGRERVTIQEALAHPTVMREEGSGTRAAVLDALRKADRSVTIDDFQVAAEAGSTEAVRAFVRHGVGTAFVSSLAVTEDLEARRLVAVPVAGFDVTRSFHLVGRQEPYLGPAARAFRTLVADGA
jgi:DNA-binding transcriptional LysR family regulator